LPLPIAGAPIGPGRISGRYLLPETGGVDTVAHLAVTLNGAPALNNPFVLAEQRGRIGLLTLNRPDSLNPISEPGDCADMIAALESLAARDDVSVIVLTGAGRGFSSGGNVKAIRDRAGATRLDTPAATRENYRRGIQKMVYALYNVDVPTIAAVNGVALGLGNDIACACDIRIAADNARFASTFVKLGIIPGDGGAWLLPRAVGWQKAAEMLFTGDMISADEALACGLVARVVPVAELMPVALSLAERIAANPPQALRMAKRLFRESQHGRLPDVMELSAAFQAIAHETGDHEEAMAAFFDKRPPVFTGR